MISRWETGKRLPDPMNIFKLAILYRTLVDCLFVDLMRLLRAEILESEEKVLKQNQNDR